MSPNTSTAHPNPGRTAVVTGAAGAIGAAVVGLLRGRGYHVIAVDRDGDGLAELPEPVTRLPLDLTDAGFEEAIVAAVERRGGSLDLLVHNAGTIVPQSVDQRTPDATRREQLTNLMAPMLLTEALWFALSRAKGMVVAVGSAGAVYPVAGSPGYSASKAGLRAYLLSLAASRRRTGVRVAMVHPSAVDTPMLRFEAEHGGSMLSFLHRPLDPGAVAHVVVARVGSRRLETFLPRSSEWQLKLLSLFPALAPRMQPVLDRLARGGRRRYLKAKGASVASMRPARRRPESARSSLSGSS